MALAIWHYSSFLNDLNLEVSYLHRHSHVIIHIDCCQCLTTVVSVYIWLQCLHPLLLWHPWSHERHCLLSSPFLHFPQLNTFILFLWLISGSISCCCCSLDMMWISMAIFLCFPLEFLTLSQMLQQFLHCPWLISPFFKILYCLHR